jgi:hypothetical protein
MNIFEKYYLQLIALHVVIGGVIYLIPPLAKVYSVVTLIIGFFWVVKYKNKNNEVLLVAAYIVGSESLLRMTEGSLSYEFSKYGVMIFMILGMYYSGFSKKALPYWIYLLLLIPGIIVATQTLNLTTNFRTTIAFNISGPICVGIASLYTFDRKISFDQINNVLLFCGLPLISTAVYLFFYTPDLKEVLVSTGSNFKTSGGFGPNQVATVLGLGMFIFLNRILLKSKTKILFIVNSFFAIFIAYRGLLTFSRGGMITGFVIIIILLFILYKNSKHQGKIKLNFLLGFLALMLVFTWSLTSFKTGGLIEKRYANQDARGRVKSSQFTGREEILKNELAVFLDNPIFGVGVAKGLEIREKETGLIIVSHNEISRTLAEHGTIGIIMLLILFFTPMFKYLNNKRNIYVFSFIFFWILTINHAAMRIAAPAFIYSLSLLKVNKFEEDSLHRE